MLHKGLAETLNQKRPLYYPRAGCREVLGDPQLHFSHNPLHIYLHQHIQGQHLHCTTEHNGFIVFLVQSRRRLSVAQNGAPRMSQERVELRLLSIPIVFLLLRLWGTIQFFYSLSLTSSAHVEQCIPKTKYRVLLWLGVMQVNRLKYRLIVCIRKRVNCDFCINAVWQKWSLLYIQHVHSIFLRIYVPRT